MRRRARRGRAKECWFEWDWILDHVTGVHELTRIMITKVVGLLHSDGVVLGCGKPSCLASHESLINCE